MSQFVDEADLLPIDRLFGVKYGATPANQLFLANLFVATRQGHLCIESGEGACAIDGIVTCAEGHYYLERYARAEELVARCAVRLAQGHPSETYDVTCDHLLPEQQSVVERACQSCLTMVCGGPGTGKSYTASALIRGVHKWGGRVAVCAPTGKAVSNLRRALNGVEGIEMRTIHALLGLRSGWDFNRPAKLIGADLVVVDEASMIDVALFAQLFRALKPGAHLVLMGDPDQLPPVEAGSLFTDLASALPDCVVELTRCMRTDLEPIVSLARAVREGDIDGALKQLRVGGAVSFREVERPSDLIDGVWPLRPNQRILTPLRKGRWGCEGINQSISERFLKGTGPLSLPIMVRRNDYKVGLFNGEIGELTLPPGAISMDTALRDPRAIATFEGHGDPIAAPMLPACEIAFALSVHKSQGSEFEEVVMIVPPQAEGWGRELLYTAITRAKARVEIVGSHEALASVVAFSQKRHSGLQRRVSSLLS